MGNNLCIACTGIIWDIDDEQIDLPTAVVIKNHTQEMIEDMTEHNDSVVDYLSNTYGFCISGYWLSLCDCIEIPSGCGDINEYE